jgi:hypothetical membrane protein
MEGLGKKGLQAIPSELPSAAPVFGRGMRSNFVLTAGLILGFGVAAPEIVGRLTPGYDPSTQYLSELGATGAANANIMNFAAFLPAGVLWLIAILFLVRLSPKGAAFGAALLALTALSYVGAAFFPCDPGCPAQGSERQLMHNLTGLLGYAGAAPGLILLGVHYLRRGPQTLGFISLAAAALFTVGFVQMLTADASNGAAPLGAWQRLADYSLFVWMFLAAQILSRRGGGASAVG